MSLWFSGRGYISVGGESSSPKYLGEFLQKKGVESGRFSPFWEEVGQKGVRSIFPGGTDTMEDTDGFPKSHLL